MDDKDPWEKLSARLGPCDPSNPPEPEDPTDSPEWQVWIEGLAKHCRCRDNRPCDGLMAGGPCDELGDLGDELLEDADERLVD